MSFSPGQPSSHQPLISSFPTSDPRLLHAPILFCREKEGNVWAPCLLLGVSSDGFNHPWVPSSSSPQSLSFSFFQTLFHLIPLCFLSFVRDVAPAMLVFNCAFVCESEWGVHRWRDPSSSAVSVGVFFLVPSVCDGHEWAVWSVSFFLLVGCPFLWLECIFTLLTLLSPPVIWCNVSVVCCAETGRLFFFTVTPEIVQERPSTELLYRENRLGCMNLTASVCVISGSNSSQVTQCVLSTILAAVCVSYLFTIALSVC